MYDHLLDIFIAIAEHKSVSAAARSCFITPAAVSQQLSLLESRLGVRLFERSNRGMALTPAGSYLLDQAKQLISASQRAINQAKLIESGGNQGLIIANDLIIHGFMYDAVDAYTRRMPQSRVSYIPSRNGCPIEDVASGDADLCVYGLGKSLLSSGLCYTALFEDTEYCVISKQSSLAEMSRVRIDDLEGFDVVMPLPGYADASDTVIRYAEETGVFATRRRSGIDEGVLVQMLASNTRLAAIRLGHHLNAYPGLVTLPFEGFSRPTIAIAYRATHKPEVDVFVEAAKEAVGART